MKPSILIVIAIVAVGGMLFWHRREVSAPAAAVTPPAGESLHTTAVRRGPSGFPAFAAGVPPVNGERPAPLPLNVADLPASPELENAERALEKTYGPMWVNILNNWLARRAQLAACGIRAPGGIMMEIRANVDPDSGGKTFTTHQVRIINSSFSGRDADQVKQCVDGAVLHEVKEAAIEGPNGVRMNPNQATEFDIVEFPIENDRLYTLLKTGVWDSFSSMPIRKKYGWD
jgi:hypothetical protein